MPGTDAPLESVTLLSGEIPDAASIPSGCRFRSRCPVALPECEQTDPELLPVSADHAVACVRSR